MAEAWSILYTNALHSQSSELLEAIQIACNAMRARLRVIALRKEASFYRERKALWIGLTDLHVIRYAYKRSQRGNPISFHA